MIRKEPVKVLIVSGSEKGYEYLASVLSPPSFEIAFVTSNAGEAKRRIVQEEYDIAVINAPLKDEFGIDFASDIAQSTCLGVLMLVKSDLYEQVLEKVEGFGVLTLPKPTNSSIVYAASRLCAATHIRLTSEEKKNEDLKTKIEEVHLVNRAKWLLIENLGVSEAEAHRLIEKQAMDLRQSKKDVCIRLIRTYEN